MHISNNLLGVFRLCFLFACCSFSVYADQDHASHFNHSDDLLILLKHKIALQKLQQQQQANPEILMLDRQGRHFAKVMPILKKYTSIPQSYYLTQEMYQDSLENRAAMLADFSELLMRYQQQLEKSRQLN